MRSCPSVATEMCVCVRERVVQYRSSRGLDVFRLVVPPLQPGVVGLYLARGERLPSHSTNGGSQVMSRYFGP
jgi:hypothetical protein